ncbi:MAG: hypothetical protein DRO01_08135, partial [Thermoproteota archaeon]
MKFLKKKKKKEEPEPVEDIDALNIDEIINQRPEDQEEEDRGQELGDLKLRVSEIEGKMERMESVIDTTRTEISSVREDLSKIQEDIKELLSIYEMVSKKFNPFIEEVEAGEPKDLDALSPQDDV